MASWRQTAEARLTALEEELECLQAMRSPSSRDSDMAYHDLCVDLASADEGETLLRQADLTSSSVDTLIAVVSGVCSEIRGVRGLAQKAVLLAALARHDGDARVAMAPIFDAWCSWVGHRRAFQADRDLDLVGRCCV